MLTEIPFTQFLRPDGRKKPVNLPVKLLKPEVVEKAESLLLYGARFEIEELTTGEIHMDCSISDEGPLALRICSNGPEVISNIASMIEEAYSLI